MNLETEEKIMIFRNLPEADTIDKWIAQSTHPVPHTADDILFSLTVKDPFRPEVEYHDSIASARKGNCFIFFHHKSRPGTMKFAVCSCKHLLSVYRFNYGQLEMSFCELESARVEGKDKPYFFLDLACPFTERGMSRFAKLSISDSSFGCIDNFESAVKTFEHDVLGTMYMAFAADHFA